MDLVEIVLMMDENRKKVSRFIEFEKAGEIALNAKSVNVHGQSN